MAVIDELPVVSGAEITVECNPDSVDRPLLGCYQDHGVNRLSFGVQSMEPHVLRSLGRTHDRAHVKEAVAAARSVGFERINLDVIYGAAGESLGDWESTLIQVLELEPDHISAYGLTVEPGTALYDDPSRHPDDDDQADKYLLADDILGAAGLGNYEISNWARPGEECSTISSIGARVSMPAWAVLPTPTSTAAASGRFAHPNDSSKVSKPVRVSRPAPNV